VLRQPEEIQISPEGGLVLPLSLLAEAGLDPGSRVVAYSDGPGRIVLRRTNDVLDDLLRSGALG
jgi:bifunctional DNA-binding transcriptional regulator/antitoxin component of YhaV-PrlF toxin-antitoxin module